MKTRIVLGLSFLFSLTLGGQNFNKAKLDSLLLRIERNQKGMGSLSIFKKGEEVYHNAFGYGDVALEKKADIQTQYRIGSISKSFTAVLIMQLVEEGRLSLETPLGLFFPTLPNAPEITIEQLLRHRSGLYNFTNAEDYTTLMMAPKNRQEMLALIKENGTVFAPGEKAAYSNTNYILLGYIIEEIEKTSYAAALQKRIAEPLKLTHTAVGDGIETNKNEAQSYRYTGKNWVQATETDMSIPGGAGAIVSTSRDLNIFFSALFNEKLVRKTSLEKMKHLEDNFGMGLFVFPFNDKKAYGHNGGIDGFVSSAAYFPTEEVSIAYVANGMVMPLNDILLGVLSIYFGEPYDLPVFSPPLVLSEQELTQYVGVYSSPAFPLKITIAKEAGGLTAQATGQPAFPLEAYDKDAFRFEMAGIEMRFAPKENTMHFKQGGASFELTRE